MKKPPYVLMCDGKVMALCDNLAHGSTLADALKRTGRKRSIGLWSADYKTCHYTPARTR